MPRLPAALKPGDEANLAGPDREEHLAQRVDRMAGNFDYHHCDGGDDDREAKEEERLRHGARLRSNLRDLDELVARQFERREVEPTRCG